MPKKTDYAVLVTDRRFGVAIRVIPAWEQEKYHYCGKVAAVVKGTTRAELSDLLKEAAGFALQYMEDGNPLEGAKWMNQLKAGERLFSDS